MDFESPSTPSTEVRDRDPALAAAVMEATNALLVVLDRAGNIVRFNRACEQVTGYRFEEIEGRPFFMLLPPEDVERYRVGFARLVSQNVPVPNENAWVGRDGSRRIVSWRNSTLLDAEGRVVYVVSTGVDVTEERRAHAELERLRELDRRRADEHAVALAKLEAVVDSMGQALLIADPQGRVVTLNQAARELLGFTRPEDEPADMDGFTALFELSDAQGHLVPEEQLPMRRAMRGERVRSVELQVRRVDTGKRFVGLFSFSPAIDRHGQAVLSVLTIQDVTEMKRTEEELRRSEERLRALSENSPDYISRLDLQLRHLYVNAAVLRARGTRPESIIDRTIAEAVPGAEEYVRPYEEALRQALLTARSGQVEIRIPSPDGAVVIQFQIVPEFGPDGSVQSLLAIGHDVSELRKALETARASAAELRAALDAVPAAVFVTHGTDARRMEGNLFAYELLGLPPGSNLSKTPGPDAPSPAYRVMREGRELTGDELPVQRAATTGREVRDVEFDLVFADGRSRRMLGNVAPLLGPEGEPQGSIGLFVDITERRKGEQERERLLSEVSQLAERVARLQSATQAFSAAATSDRIAQVLLEEAARVVPPVLRGLVVVPSPEEREQLQLLASRGSWEPSILAAWGRMRLDHLDPALRERLERLEAVWLENREEIFRSFPGMAERGVSGQAQAMVLMPLATEGRLAGVVGLTYGEARRFEQAARDALATLGRLCAQALERARLYESEQRLRSAAEEEARLRERLMIVLGHDLRQPMSVISAAVGSTLHRPEQLPPRTLAPLQRSLRALGSMDSLIGLLLDYSRLRAGRGLQLETAAGDLGEWCEQALSAQLAEAPGRSLEFQREGDLRGEWDHQRIGRLVANLVSNALAYGDPASPVQVKLRARGDWLLLEVGNRGAPIPAERLREIFEPFGRARGEHARSRRGLGLGLFLVREIARAHGGTVEVRSSAEEGTVFAVSLPRRPPPAAPA